MAESPGRLVHPLLVAIEAGDRDAVAAAVRGAPVAERRAAAPTILVVAKQLERASMDAFMASFRAQDHTVGVAIHPSPGPVGEHSAAANLALHGVASVAEFRGLGRAHFASAEDDLLVDVVLDRGPEWVAGWLDAAFDVGTEPIIGWPLVRRLVVDSGITPPAHDRYIATMIAGTSWTLSRDRIDQDPALLDYEVWRLFEVPGTRENSLANSAKYSGAGWADALAGLAADGKLDRPRLLDATLSALARDWGAYRLSWYSAFWKRLEPTDDERAARTAQLVRLLASTAPTIVGFATDELHAVVKGGGSVPGLLPALAPALQSPTKRTATRALAIVDLLQRSGAVTVEEAAVGAAAAVAHPKPEVQRAALARIAGWTPAPGATVRDALAAVDALVAATERPAYDALLSAGPDGSASAGASQAAGAADATRVPTADELRTRAAALPEFVRAALELDAALADPERPLPAAPIAGEPLLDPDEVVSPMASVDELGDALLTAAAVGMGRSFGAVEQERLLDAIDRWCGDRSLFDGPLRPLDKLGRRPRAEDDWGWVDAVDVAIAWRDARVPTDSRDLATTPRRLLERLQRAATGDARPTLALPTHRGGWIDPSVLVDRIAALPGERAGAAADDDLELAQALLRIPTRRELVGDDGLVGAAAGTPSTPDVDGSTAALDRAQALAGRAAELLAATLAATAVDGTGAAVDVVNARATVRADDVRQLAVSDEVDWNVFGLDPSARGEGYTRWSQEDAASHSPIELLLRLTERTSWSATRQAADLAIAAPAWRTLGQIVDARQLGHCDLVGTVEHTNAEGRPLQLLLSSSEPIGWHAAHVLTGGLVAQRPEVHLLAVDATLAAIEDGRLDAPLLGVVLRDGLESGRLPANRLAARLAMVGEVSPLHFAVARDALERTLDLDSRPNNLAALLEVLDQWTARHETAIRVPAVRNFLQSLGGSSKSTKLARSILARTEPPPTFEAPLRLEARLRRGERWARLAADPAA